jgi:hypothetical protein
MLAAMLDAARAPAGLHRREFRLRIRDASATPEDGIMSAGPPNARYGWSAHGRSWAATARSSG